LKILHYIYNIYKEIQQDKLGVIIMKLLLYVYIFILTLGYAMPVAMAQEDMCFATDKACMLILLENEAQQIKEERWRDQTYRELAKLLASGKKNKKAISIIDKIKSSDTKAMTIRGIGMAAADTKLSKKEYDSLFSALTTEANKITHAPSLAIALTYIAMAQAFAGDNEGAMATATDMENETLRHKAFGETAEIQAERGDLKSAQKSLNAIDSQSYRNKANHTVAKIFAQSGKYTEALEIAMNIENHYQKAQAILYILVQQNTMKEVSIE